MYPSMLYRSERTFSSEILNQNLRLIGAENYNEQPLVANYTVHIQSYSMTHTLHIKQAFERKKCI